MTEIKIGLIEPPSLPLIDPEGKNWGRFKSDTGLGSWQILAGSLLSAGYQVDLINLKQGREKIFIGETAWRNMRLEKIAWGTDWRTLDAKSRDVWGISVNFLVDREIVCKIIEYLSLNGGRVVVGGSDVFAEPEPYLQAGACVVVMDKSGASNQAAINVALGKNPEGSYRLLTRDRKLSNSFSPLSPEEWPLPPVEIARQTLGKNASFGPTLSSPIGAAMFDQGCDRHCDFCETPLYRMRYQYMSVKRALEWISLQKRAGAKSFECWSDQFMGRILFPKTGRQEILDIMQGIRDLEIDVQWPNGLELSKATLGRGKKDGDLAPDEELINALWGWDGKKGCTQSYLPAERPIEGRTAYAKLLPWQDHVRLVKAIVRAGIPSLSYGVIIGLPDDSQEKMMYLYEALFELRSALLDINPNLALRVIPQSITAIPGTPLTARLKQEGFLRYSDPAIVGNRTTPACDTKYMSHGEVADWQMKFWKNLIGIKGYHGTTAFE